MVEAERTAAPTGVVVPPPRTSFVPHPIPAPRRAPVAVRVPHLAPATHGVPAPRPPAVRAATPVTGSPRPAWVPSGYDAPPAGLDRPLDGPPVIGAPPRTIPSAPARASRRTEAAVAAGALGAGIAVLATRGTALTALAQTAGPAASAPTRAAPSTARQCSDAVADELDETASALRSGSRTTWSSTVSSHADSVADTYGRGSTEYAAYTDGAAEILSWLTDASATESYQNVVDRVVSSVVTTCDRAST